MGAFKLAVCTPWALSNWRSVLHGRFRIVRGRVQIGDIGAEGVDCEAAFKSGIYINRCGGAGL